MSSDDRNVEIISGDEPKFEIVGTDSRQTTTDANKTEEDTEIALGKVVTLLGKRWRIKKIKSKEIVLRWLRES